MNRLFVLFSLLLFSNGICAQKTHIVTLKPRKITLPPHNFYLQKTIDQRPNKKTIGFAQIGINNKKVNANFNQATDLHLHNALNWLLLTAKERKNPVIAVIHKLYISERTEVWKEYGLVEISIEFITPDNLTYGLFSTRVESKGMKDTTKDHDNRIREGLENIVRDFIYSKPTPSKRSIVPLPVAVDFNKLVELKEGAYRNFTDLQRNEPTKDIQFDIKPWKKGKLGRYDLFVKGTDYIIKDLPLFGVAANNEVYLSAANYDPVADHFVKAQLKGRYLFFVDRTDPTPNTNGLIGAAGFGLLGGVAATVGGRKKWAILLDTHTGLIIPLDFRAMEILLEDFPDLWEKYERIEHPSIEKKKIFIKTLNKRLMEKKL